MRVVSIGFVLLHGGGRLVALDGRTRLTHRQPTCSRLARYKAIDIVEVDVRGGIACVANGATFPVRWCPQCGFAAVSTAWRARAACVGSDVDFFDWRPGTVLAALAMCRGCSVRAECGEYAEAIGAPEGVWGGGRRAA